MKRFLSIEFTANFFETFLFGLITCFVYFNLLSFFIPADYLTLVPLLFISVYTFSKKTVRQDFLTRTSHLLQFFFSKKNLSFVIPFICLLFIYWVIPPYNADSGEYHYISIRWYEQFKVVPGLGNVHGRLAFNPASFIISAAWSFTDVAGQPIYPLNGVLCLLFYAWLLKRIIIQPANAYNLMLLLMAILLFRTALANISSPSSDLLSGLLIFYCGFRTYELIKENKNLYSDYFPVLIVACFSITAKLSAIPSLLVLPFIYFVLINKNKQAAIVVKTIMLASLIIIPWLARNFILSGYLLYPILGSNFFHADWAVPHDVIKLDFIFSKYGPRSMTVDFLTMQKMNVLQLIVVWLGYMYSNFFFSLVIFFVSFLSPVTWLFFRLQKKKIPLKIFLLWIVYYMGMCAWLLNSPEFRFGLSYIILALSLPVFELVQPMPVRWKIPRLVPPALICICLIYYAVSAVTKNSFYFSLTGCWLKPLRDRRYFAKNHIHTFPSVNLGNGVRLYVADKEHECLNATGPCMNWRYGEIEMRGNKIEDGFRNVKDEVKQYFPFVEAK
ncbi:MAG: hypothetical protein ABJB86_09890 [Bacteroidota bacterium]